MTQAEGSPRRHRATLSGQTAKFPKLARHRLWQSEQLESEQIAGERQPRIERLFPDISGNLVASCVSVRVSRFLNKRRKCLGPRLLSLESPNAGRWNRPRGTFLNLLASISLERL